jgi:ribosomal protein L14
VAYEHANLLRISSSNGSVEGGDLIDAIVVTTGSEAYRRTDGIGVVPAALLGP